MRDVVFEKLCRFLAILFMAVYIIYDLTVYQIPVFNNIIEVLDLNFDTFITFYKYEILRYAVMILAILVLIVYPKGGLALVMCTCSLVIAAHSAIDAYLNLVEYREFIINAEFFLNGVICLVIAAMLFVNTLTFMRGLSKSTTLIKYAILALSIIELLAVIMMVREGEDSDTIFQQLTDTFTLIELQILVLLMTSSRAIKQKSIMGNIGSSIRDMRTMMMEEGIGISRPIAARFSDFNRDGLWCDSYSFILTSFKGVKFSMTMTSSGKDTFASIASIESHSVMNSFRFDVTGIWFDTGDVGTCDLMRFYGTDGVFIQLIVRDVPERRIKKTPKIGQLMLISREVGTRTHKINVAVSVAAFKFNDLLQKLRIKKKNNGGE